MVNAATPDTLHKVRAHRRAANCLSLGQVDLQDNALLDAPLALAHIQPRLRVLQPLASQVAAETARFDAPMQRHKRCIGEPADDMPEILDWQWTP